MKNQILVVEDNEINRAILCEILSGEYQVLEAENGQEALNVLQQHKDRVALILLDVMMPVMDGYTFLDRIRSDKELSLIPVIVTTQSDSEEDELAALAHGATDFVPKPYRSQVILHRVASLIRLRETAAMVNQFKYDRLTGVYSKEFFYHKVREQLLEDQEHEYTIVCSNIENFKLVNDAFGFQAGDSMLKEVANISQSMIGSTGFCGRFTADRFLCFQRRELELRDRENFENLMERDVPPLLKNIVIRWGIYEITDRSIPVEQMCDRALLAANSIKGQYNHFFAVYDDSLRNKLLREQAIIDAMETALSEEQFAVYLQPKYSLNEDCIAGAEALVRWIHPDWGFMSPGEFIPLFEKKGLILRLDQYVWEKVCALLRSWQDQGYPLLPVSVNISRSDMYHVDLVSVFQGLIEKYDLDPAYLHLEITESAYAENPGPIISTIEELHQLGFIVEMDDFGSGYSSLNMLSQMKLDVLKLDMKFIQNEIAVPAEQSILPDVIAMAHRMRLSVVAEGVESRNQMERLRAVGCDYAQGYYFAKPMPATEYEELLKAYHMRNNGSMQRGWKTEIKQYSLMVVDEDAEYRKKVRETFKEKYRVLEASDAESALDYVKTCSTVAIVILSMTLPENGAALLMKALRQDPAFWKVPVLATIPGGERMGELPLALETDDFLCKCHPLFDLKRRVQRLLEMAAFSERESTLQDAANRDYLTGLLNRRGLEAAMASVRKEEQPLAVLLFDLDNLKEVNDNYGHDMGDRMIRAFSELLHRKTRAGDILCRYGGDEFVVILKHLSDVENVIKQSTDICRSFYDVLAGEHLSTSCSVGIAWCGADEKLSSELIEHADQALYRAKRENKGGCCLWSNALDYCCV